MRGAYLLFASSTPSKNAQMKTCHFCTYALCGMCAYVALVVRAQALRQEWKERPICQAQCASGVLPGEQREGQDEQEAENHSQVRSCLAMRSCHVTSTSACTPPTTQMRKHLINNGPPTWPGSDVSNRSAVALTTEPHTANRTACVCVWTCEYVWSVCFLVSVPLPVLDQ